MYSQSITDYNANTLQSYEAAAGAYASERQNDDMATHYKWLVDDIAESNVATPLFEIGSGPGYLADYLEALGYQVTRTDAAQSFVDFNLKRGKKAEKFNLVTDDFLTNHDVVYAISVVQHFERGQAMQAFSKVYDSLNPGGRFMFTLTIGDGSDEWHDDEGGKRYFYQWNIQQLEHELKSIGFFILRSEDVGYKNWRRITVEKKSES